MNVNGLITSLGNVVNCPVAPDLYEGSKEKYITYTYEDERSAMDADNEEIQTVAYLQITLYTPPQQEYMEDKSKIKAELKKLGFCVESIQSWVDSYAPEKKRHTVFNVNITMPEQ